MSKELFKEVYQMNRALDILKDKKQRVKLTQVLMLCGMSEDDIVKTVQFVVEKVSSQEYLEELENQAIISYVESFKNVKKYFDMAKGYEDMAEINSEISEEMRHLEDEGEMVTDEVVSKNSKNQA